MLVTSIFSFSQNVSYSPENKFQLFSHIYLSSATALILDWSKILSFGKVLKADFYKAPKFLFSTFRTKVCCGIIFKGMNGEVLIDPQLLQPCWSCHKGKSSTNKKTELLRSTSLEDTDSNSSTPSLGAVDYYESNTIEPETPPDSPPNSPKSKLTETANTLAQLQKCTTMMDFTAPVSLTMEC